MADRIIFYDRAGVPLEEIAGRARCRWALNDVGTARITIPLTEPKLRAEVIRYGNFVRAQHRTAGDWAGVIRTPETWTDSAVEVTALTAEALLRDRWGKTRLEGSAGERFAALIELANTEEDTRLRVDEVDDYGPTLRERVDFEPLLDVLRRTHETDGGDWGVEPALDALGHLIFKASWYARRGVRRAETLREGHNVALAGRILVAQGEIANDVFAFDDRAAPTERRTFRVVDEASITQFGLRQAVIAVVGEAPDSVSAAARAELARRRALRRVFMPIVVEPTPGDIYPFLGLGDTVGLQWVRAGFGIETRVRILAKEFDDTEGKMPLVVEEVAEE